MVKEKELMRTIVVSAVNIRKGGTLTILRDCLEYLSGLTVQGNFRIVALVHRKELVEYSGIEYIEMPDTIKSWWRRLWCEYITMYYISKSLSPVHLWLSLHDTTPCVKAKMQAVYCQTSFPFLRWRPRDVLFDYKIVLFALFTRFIYQFNIQKNNYLIVQTDWLRHGFARMFGLSESRFIVASPSSKQVVGNWDKKVYCKSTVYTFLFAATPDCHKNFEIICRALEMLERELGTNRCKVILTVNGKENKYSQWLYKKWGNLDSLEFAGFMSRSKLYDYYANVDCLIFPSRVETWGLPISEFAIFGKPMLLADLPYAHETAAGSKQTAFFNPESPENLRDLMRRLIDGDRSFLVEVSEKKTTAPAAKNWKELFDLLLDGE